MPEKSIKPSDDEQIIEAEVAHEFTLGAGEQAGRDVFPVEIEQENTFIVIDPVIVEQASAASIELQSGEIISPIELAAFMAETVEDPTNNTEQTSIEAAPTETAAYTTEQTPATAIETAQAARAIERRHVVKSAALVSIGNLGSSLLGMVRQIVVSALGPPIAGPFNAALTPANNFYQLLINGSVSGALVPTFNDYAAPEKRQEMRRIVFTVVNLILLLALVASIGYALISPWFVNVLVNYKDPNARVLTLRYSQIIFFSLVALGPFAVLLSALFALKEFGWPAFATAAYHVGIILGSIGVILFGSFALGNMALPTGVLLGALGEIALLFPGIRRQRFYYMFVLDLKHPALRRIIKLYFPILVSYIFTTALVFLDVRLWTQAGGDGRANTVAQATATALLQFPVGLVAMALGFAVLPTLSEHAREGNDERFKATLLLGLRVGLLLMIPAMVGMWALRLPIVYLLFAHHNNTLADAGLSALALQNYVYQLPFVAVDQLLIAAFYARKNTLTPVVVGIVCIGFYLLVALPFYQTIGIAALAFANTVQNSMHAVILLFLLRKAMGSLHIRQTIPAILKICVAAAAMGLVAWGVMALLGHVALFSLDHLIGQFLTVVVAGSLAVAVYIGGVLLFKVEEVNLVKGALLAKFRRQAPV
jgi:putative peptidoglycan lipid II flippase